MSGAKEWAVPIVLGLVVGLGLWALVDTSPAEDDPATDGGHGTSQSGTTSQGPQPIVLPFAESWGEPGRNTTHLLLAPLGRAAAEQRIAAAHLGGFGGSLDWMGAEPKLALYSHVNVYTGCQPVSPGSNHSICSDPAWVFGDWPYPRTQAVRNDDTGPRLLHGGYNATRATAYVFDEAGLLLASNAPANETARFTKHGDYTRLPSTAWYLGANQTAPPGTQHLPSFAKPLVDRVRPELDGLPEGGVASVRSNAYAALYGSLFVTVRVDDLVHAP